ncbi:unnamed protein product [Rotaria magnacalcarata]|uniref:TFIIB-type domain-containing protein n=1 Tax=Rotaria magnacalcarata TaxID=392030 RepID=A0A820PVS6_9BILA|nr:unnamed protein product [Rotaria magnacalcarata]
MSRYVKQLECRFHPDATLVEDYRAGDMVCPECGLVVGDRVQRVQSFLDPYQPDHIFRGSQFKGILKALNEFF